MISFKDMVLIYLCYSFLSILSHLMTLQVSILIIFLSIQSQLMTSQISFFVIVLLILTQLMTSKFMIVRKVPFNWPNWGSIFQHFVVVMLLLLLLLQHCNSIKLSRPIFLRFFFIFFIFLCTLLENKLEHQKRPNFFFFQKNNFL